MRSQACHIVGRGLLNRTWFKVPLENIKSESGAERLGLVSMHAGEVRGAVVDLSGPLPSLTLDTFLAKFGYFYAAARLLCAQLIRCIVSWALRL